MIFLKGKSSDLILPEFEPVGPAQFDVIYYLLKQYNFRISEILKINIHNKTPDGYFIVPISKCDDVFLLSDNIIDDYIAFNPISKSGNIFNASYKMVYNFFLKNHANDIIIKGKGNNKVLHAFRYKKAKLYKDHNLEGKVLQTALHHKSLKSQIYYLPIKN